MTARNSPSLHETTGSTGDAEAELGMLLLGSFGTALALILPILVTAFRWMPALLLGAAGALVLLARLALLQNGVIDNFSGQNSSPQRLTKNLELLSGEIELPSPQDAAWSVFCQGVIAPELITERIRERVEPLTRALQFARTYEINLPASTNPIYVPIMKSRKGELYDDLTIECPGEQHSRILSFHDQTTLASFFFEKLLTNVVEDDDLRDFANRARTIIASGPSPESLSTDPNFKTAIMERSSVPRDARVRELLKTIEAAMEGATKKDFRGQVATAIQLVEELSRFYVTTIELPPSDSPRGLVVVSRFRKIVQSSYLGQSRPSLARALDMLRVLAAVRSSRFKILIESMYACRSYHVEVFGPPGTFLARQEYDLGGQSGEPYIRLRRRLGQRYAHLYCRGGFRLRYSDGTRALIRLDLGFVERTPGTVAAVTVSAFGSAVLIWIAGRVSGHDHGVDVVALLLAFPPAASAWLQLGRQHSPFVGLLLTRVISLVTIVASVLTGALYLGALDNSLWQAQLAGPGLKGLYAVFFSVTTLAAMAGSYAWARRALLEGTMLAREPEPEPKEVYDVRSHGELG